MLLFPIVLPAQVNTTSFGFVVKPIFPSKFFRTGAQTQDVVNDTTSVSFRLAQSSGFSAGAVVRKGITKNISAETGIQFVKRLYHLNITDDSTNFTENTEYKIVGYEVPLQVLVFVQLSKEIWMNASLGTSIDIFPSDVSTSGDHFKQYAARKSNFSVFNTGVTANLGWEYRTEKNGIIYIGGSYHRSLNDTYRSIIEYYYDIHALNPAARTVFTLKGDYLTLDLRYYFQGDVNKKKNKKK